MIIENPFVERDDLRNALDPAGHSPETAVRRLREAGFISHGIELRLHVQGKLRGARVYYCALNLDAAEAVRDGDDVAARELAHAAASVESNESARDVAVALLAARDPRELSPKTQRAASTLARRIARIRNRLAHGTNPLVGLVIETSDNYGTVRTEHETVVVPRATLQARGLDWLGAPVAIRTHSLTTGAMVHSVEEALALDDDDRNGARPFDPFAMRSEQRGTPGDPLLDQMLARREPIRLLAPIALAR